MHATLPPALQGTFASVSACPSRLQRLQCKLTASFFLLAALLCIAPRTAPAQTAHFSGSAPLSWVQSTTPILGEVNGIALDGSGNFYLAAGSFVVKSTPSANM